MIVGPHSTKLPQSWDTESDQLGVPARFSKIAQFPTRRSGCLGVQVFHECSKTYLLQTQRFSVALHDWFIHIDACIYQTSVSSLVEFRKPLGGTAPSVIPIQRGSIATSGRCALLALFLFFLSSCFSLLLPGADMSYRFLLGLRVAENVFKCSFHETDRLLL